MESYLQSVLNPPNPNGTVIRPCFHTTNFHGRTCTGKSCGIMGYAITSIPQPICLRTTFATPQIPPATPWHVQEHAALLAGAGATWRQDGQLSLAAWPHATESTEEFGEIPIFTLPYLVGKFPGVMFVQVVPSCERQIPFCVPPSLLNVA